ncbi:hypothetical protein [Sphingopyxis sp. BSNA05]|uniref:hypothetical protein n=1 Tax=Sphingopyxis sp. BSNA05 TaxID=1236614 RepID=UPI001C26B83E|nr:hypothetical protein [Sphingopyxis sp. BSNA05]
MKVADTIAPKQLYFSKAEGAQISSAVIEGAYPDTRFTRTLALFWVDGLSAPLALDIVRVQSDSPHQYDLPLHYQGHIMRVGFDTESHIAARPVLGTGNGYQHIWVDAVGKPQGQNGFVTTLLDGRFYTYRFVPQKGAETVLAEIGANDPRFNLRREPMVIQRIRNAQNTTFVSMLESHGRYDGAAEQTVGSDSLIKSLSHESVNGSDIVIVEKLDGKKIALVVSYDSDAEKKHSVKLGHQMLNWTGFAARIDLPAGKAKR